MRFLKFLGFALVLLFCGKSMPAFAWGHLVDLNGSWGKASLIHRVLEEHAITYCLEIEDPSFDFASIDTQIKFALQLWLEPLYAMGIPDTTISSTECSTNQFDLKIQIGPEKEHPILGAFHQPQHDQLHYYSLVKINSNYSFLNSKTGQNYPKTDFLKLVPQGNSLLEFLHYTSRNFLSVQKFSEELRMDYYAVYESSYRTLLHELGHSFGLCDLYQSQLKSCDPQYMLPNADEVQPASLMKEANYFYLTPDDIEGMRSLARRFL